MKKKSDLDIYKEHIYNLNMQKILLIDYLRTDESLMRDQVVKICVEVASITSSIKLANNNPNLKFISHEIAIPSKLNLENSKQKLKNKLPIIKRNWNYY